MDYHIRPLGKTCAGSGQPLEPGTRVFSVLVERSGELVRLDYAAAEWKGAPAGSVGQWQCAVPELDPNKGAVLDPEALLSYFEQVLENANPAQEQLAYVLALFLLQKRRLRLEGSRADGDIQYLQLTGSRGEGPFEVRDQQLPDDEIKRLQGEIGRSLQTEWNAA
jgi:hypothetical protein